jgi:NAD(P)-dependent dehydrogenase (short-subunit alcohol dehydrogenase family)
MGAIEEVGMDAWRCQFETNVFGLVRLTQLVLPGMRARGAGRIINVSSAGGEMTFPLAGAYHASKYALEALSDALRFEVRPFGIDVVLIQPGVVNTPLADATVNLLRTTPDSPYAPMVNSFARRSRESHTNGQGYVQPEQVATVIVRAAQSRRPRTRYKVGALAHIIPFLRHVLTDRGWDGMIVRMFPVEAESDVGRREKHIAM